MIASLMNPAFLISIYRLILGAVNGVDLTILPSQLPEIKAEANPEKPLHEGPGAVLYEKPV